MKNLVNRAVLALTASAAYATSVMASSNDIPIALPEPTALGLLTMGVAGVVLAMRARKK